MRSVLGLILFVAVAGCSLVGEKGPGPKIVDNEPKIGGCDFPARDSFVPLRNASRGTLYQTLDCTKEKLDSAFAQIKGKRPGEISVSELRTLYNAGLLKLDSLAQYETDASWEWLGELIATLHPDGRPAISQQAAHRILEILRGQVPLFRDWMETETDGRDFPQDRIIELIDRTLPAVQSLFDLLSPNWSLSLGRMRELISGSEPLLRKFPGLDEIQIRDVNEKVEAVWILKSFLLADPLGQGVRSDLRLDEIQRFLRTSLQIASQLPATKRWGLSHLNLGKIPADLPTEWGTAMRGLEQYFLDGQFTSIDSEILAWALKRLNVKGISADLASDLVRLSQRLYPFGQRGLHPRSLIPLLNQAQPLATKLIAAASDFPADCEPGFNRCLVTLRTALKSPTLKRIALKGQPNYWRNEYAKLPLERPLDGLLDFFDVTGRLAKQLMVEKIFATFDADGMGKLPLKGVYQEDLKSTLDLTYTFLRFLSAGSTSSRPSTDRLKQEEAVPEIMTLKPSSLYGLMGLLGDRWMPDGNRDNALDAHELFSVVQFYEEHAVTASRLAYSYRLQVPRYIPTVLVENPNEMWRLHDSSNALVDRTRFVRSLYPEFLAQEKAHHLFFSKVTTETMESLFHGLVSTTPRRPVKVYAYSSGSSAPQESLLENYVSVSEAQAPAAVLVAMQKLDLACDKHEDMKFDWRELDCVTPLLLEASLNIVTSAMVEMEPGVYDLSRVLLSFLQRPGIPLSLAKFVLVSGSFIKPFKSLLNDLDQWLKPKAFLDWTTLGAWVQSMQKKGELTVEELNQLGKDNFLICDVEAQDGELKGGKEMDCATKLAVSQLTDSASTLFGNEAPKGAIEKFLILVQTEVMRVAIEFGLQRPEVIAEFLAGSPLYSSKAKILGILEELLRRGQPLPPQ